LEERRSAAYRDDSEIQAINRGCLVESNYSDEMREVLAFADPSFQFAGNHLQLVASNGSIHVVSVSSNHHSTRDIRTMLKSLLLIVAVGSLTTITDLAAAASDEGACTNTPSTAAPIDLSSIPTKQVTGQQAVRGVMIDDECDDLPIMGNTTPMKIRSIDAEDDGLSGEDDDSDN
jgi:hypothetical protein